MLRNFEYSTLNDEDREIIHDALAVTTVKHIAKDQNLFSPMPFDPAQSPSQMLEVVHLSPVPASLEEIHALANIANAPLAEAARESLKKQPAYLSAIRYLMDERGENIVAATTHANIADVAIWQSGWVEAMDRDDWQERRQRNGLGISRGVTTIQAFGMAASEVVQKMGHVFMSFPRTETIQKTEIDPDLINTNNRLMRSEVKAWMSSGLPHKLHRSPGKSLHLAWEGKTTRVNYGDNHKVESLVIGKIADGTLNLVKHSIVQPVAIWEEPEPVVIIGELTEIKSRRDVDRVQAWHRETLAKIIGISPEQVAVEE